MSSATNTLVKDQVKKRKLNANEDNGLAKKVKKSLDAVANNFEKEISDNFTAGYANRQESSDGAWIAPTLKGHGVAAKWVGTGVGALNKFGANLLADAANKMKNTHPRIAQGLETAVNLSEKLGKAGSVVMKIHDYAVRGATLVVEIVNSPVYFTVDKWPEALERTCNTFFDRLEQILDEMEKKGPESITPLSERDMRDIDVMRMAHASVLNPPVIQNQAGHNLSPDITPPLEEQEQELEVV
ncbi:hypothetical protein [Rickettsiales endosymbiont of Stachyamoeba lipophora]|uniref:hypothetical protein n=1 Tax=Rickettsiales endosymbiont of Stachyamoeba lipophora TaxID=2486578 RepID=UPI000F64BA7A|nr:hypothetical protein [Rickettsiales endosymbiont of Stachyamoeba lipophora]AZL15784.1 hypothetical protein EF513_04390 [Rickettsiales endosymbiont of Stachyamoeba lipophora]